jgi:hypothetical protein
MDTHTPAPVLRREAIRRRLQGERRCDICRNLQRSTAWFDKWWAEYRHHPRTDFADRSRAPYTSPCRTPPAIEQAVLKIRQTLEAGQTSQTRYGLIGHRAIRAELQRLGLPLLPALAAIQRILARHGLTHPRGAAAATAYYPEPVAEVPNGIHATDIITRHLYGGSVVQNFHTFDHYTHAVYLSQQTDKRSATIRTHLLRTWARLGIPCLQQFDNEGSFRGGHSHPRVIGQIVRLCLFVGVEVLFLPDYEAKRNHWVEGFHALWLQAFWSRKKFANVAEVRAEAPTFLRWYHTRYQPPSLAGKTPAQMRRGWRAMRLTAGLRRLIPKGLPITRGRIHFLRKVDAMGKVRILNETWFVGRKWIGEYVWALVDTARQTLTFWHRPGTQAAWRQIKTRRYRLYEPVHPLRLEFRRKCPRCREQWPS